MTSEIPTHSCSFPSLCCSLLTQYDTKNNHQSNLAYNKHHITTGKHRSNNDPVYFSISVYHAVPPQQVLLLQRPFFHPNHSLLTHFVCQNTHKDFSLCRYVNKKKSISFCFRFAVPETLVIWSSPLNSHLGLVIIASSCSFSAPCQKLLFPTYTTIIVYLITIETKSVPSRTICLSIACGIKCILNLTT